MDEKCVGKQNVVFTAQFTSDFANWGKTMSDYGGFPVSQVSDCVGSTVLAQKPIVFHSLQMQ